MEFVNQNLLTNYCISKTEFVHTLCTLYNSIAFWNLKKTIKCCVRLSGVTTWCILPIGYSVLLPWIQTSLSLNSRDLFLNLRRLVKMTKPLRFENKSLRLRYKYLICIWIIFWAILDLLINPKYLFQNKSFSQTYYFKSEKKVLSF